MINDDLINFGIVVASIELLFVIFMIILIKDQRKNGGR